MKIRSSPFPEGLYHELGMILHTHDRHTHAYFTCRNNINTAQKSNLVLYSMSTENCHPGSHRTVTEKAVFKCNWIPYQKAVQSTPKPYPLYFRHTNIRIKPRISLFNMPNRRKHIKSAVCKHHTMKEERVNSSTERKTMGTPSSEGLFHIF